MMYNSYDTWKVEVNKESAQIEKEYIIQNRYSMTIKEKRWYYPMPIGISQIYEKANSYTIEGSAKLLGSRYLEGININTIELLVDKLNDTRIGRIEKDYFINEAKLLKIDQSSNMYVSDVGNMLKTLFASFITSDITATEYPYNRNKYESIEYWKRGAKKSPVIRNFKLYHKQPELKTGNYKLVELLGLKKVEKTLFAMRAELVLNGTRKIRQDLFPEDEDIIPTFGAVVGADVNPMKKIFEKAYMNYNDKDLMMNMYNMDSKEILDEAGILSRNIGRIRTNKDIVNQFKTRRLIKDYFLNRGCSKASISRKIKQVMDDVKLYQHWLNVYNRRCKNGKIKFNAKESVEYLLDNIDNQMQFWLINK